MDILKDLQEHREMVTCDINLAIDWEKPARQEEERRTVNVAWLQQSERRDVPQK